MAPAARPAGRSWAPVREALARTSVGARLASEAAQRASGEGPPHVKARLRLHGAPAAAAVRATLYRDKAGWCPYCQKVWLQLEIKAIPHRIELINMRSYGPKPEEFLMRVPGGLLPAFELDGQLHTESLEIMRLIEREFPENGPAMLPEAGSSEDRCARDLLALERSLFGAWCELTFRPDNAGLFGGLFASPDSPGPSPALRTFEAKLGEVEAALARTPGSWFLGGSFPSLVDLQYVTHIERMNASVLYWKGYKLRGSGRYPSIDAWFDAFEALEAYRATKSDYFTHVRDIPPQYGPGFESGTAEQQAAAEAITGGGGAWELPLDLGPDSLEPLSEACDPGEDAARLEALYALADNADAIAKFACRGMGARGSPAYSAPLADPNARPDLAFEEPVSTALLAVGEGLLRGDGAVDLSGLRTGECGPAVREGTGVCLAYLRERVGVPRDMSFPAAMQFRAYLNLAIAGLSSG